MKKILYIVIPCYNEEESLIDTSSALKEKMIYLINKKIINKKSKIMYVNDGSNDNTWNLIKKIHNEDKMFTGICLSRNRGHQNALLAGLLTARQYADIVISMDADMQDDINVIDEIIEKNYNGNEIVYGVRNNRKNDSFLKKTTAQLFYKLLDFIGVDIIYNHADYRLTSKKVLDKLSDYKEINLFLRGIFPQIGYQSANVYYERKKRNAGKSKYSLKKMINFAWNGITSFSIKPIKMILHLGIIIFILSIFTITYSIIRKFTGHTVSGWTFIVCSIWFVAGLQMLSLGIVGEYIGKIYNEVKARPRYIISENLELEK